MKIGIDARMYGAQKNRGIGRYIEKYLQYLQEIDTENQYVVFLNADNFDLFNPSSSNFQKVKVNILWYTFSEQILFLKVLNKYKFDLVHFLNFNAPVFYKKDFVVTIHDLTMTHYSGTRATTRNKFLYKKKMIVARWLVKKVCHQAKRIIVPTEFTKGDIVKFLKIDDKKIDVIYEGVDKFDFKIEDIFLNKRFGIKKPYFFYVGAAYPHKNLELMIKAFRDFNASDKYQLVLAGPKDFFYQRLQKESVAGDEDILILGKVSDPELSALLKWAECFIFPSKVEGFGLPPLEAMSIGCPVLSSNATCLPEILDKGAIFFDPNSIDDIVEGLKKITTDVNFRNDLVAAGYENIKRFSWQRMAEEILKIFKEFD